MASPKGTLRVAMCRDIYKDLKLKQQEKYPPSYQLLRAQSWLCYSTTTKGKSKRKKKKKSI
jgi:hypothetical protein